ncbi:MAG: type I-E CRISPR-associated protein Cas6/Cse3/CasE [Thiotrichaceae bacterium]|nr:type I-E CRISPR-associated protein Cas6/Cse3/CasE [Thiotrichaceae bacterium]
MYLSRIRLKQDMQATQLAELIKDRKNYGLHHLFWGLFAHNPDKKRDFLFREEMAKEQNLGSQRLKADPVYYLQSHECPQKDHPFFDIDSKPYHPKLAIGDILSFKLRVNPVVKRKNKRHDIIMDAQYHWLDHQLNQIGQVSTGTKNDKKKRLLNFASDQQVTDWQEQIKQGYFSDKLAQQLGRNELLEWALKTAIEQSVLVWWQTQASKNGFALVQDSVSNTPIFQSSAYQWHSLPEKNRKAGYASLDLTGKITMTDSELFYSLLERGIGKSKAFGCGLIMLQRSCV